jgi:hypothetical protein
LPKAFEQLMLAFPARAKFIAVNLVLGAKFYPANDDM